MEKLLKFSEYTLYYQDNRLFSGKVSSDTRIMGYAIQL